MHPQEILMPKSRDLSSYLRERAEIACAERDAAVAEAELLRKERDSMDAVIRRLLACIPDKAYAKPEEQDAIRAAKKLVRR